MNNTKSPKERKRWAITAVTAIIAVVITSLCYVLMLLRMPGMHFAFYLVLAFSALLILYLALWTLSINDRYARIARALKRCCLICIVIAVAGFLVLEVVIISGAQSDDDTVDCMIILGAGLDGETPLIILRSRLDAALEYLETRGDIPIIVSGGQGPGETITEAEAMFRYLKARGIDENRIWKEDASTSTYENFAYSRALMEENGLDADKIKTVVVTNEFHLYRAKLIAERVGLDTVGVSAETPIISLRVLYYCREAFALVKTFLFNT